MIDLGWRPVMHRQIHAQCTLELDIRAVSPLLLQGQQEEQGPASFYRAIDPQDKRKKYCIPATSLKGVWRSAAERILRTMDDSLVCDPFNQDTDATQSCSKRFENSSPENVRHGLCPACRLFGSTAQVGVLQLQDSWISPKAKVENRTGIAIDRFTGGVKQHALYTIAPLAPGTSFRVRADIVNVDLWHLGLLALVHREMNEGRVRVGSGTHNGLGHVAVTWKLVRFRFPAGVRNTDSLPAWLLENARTAETEGWRSNPWVSYEVMEDRLDKLKRACVEELVGKLGKGRQGFAPITQEGLD
ncbi:MAG: hypothetical protein D6704_02655 [Nitrospirae bacterium]|nr:MAG: hypothetical protein D6704_02655 [Nitrospirota bacterium]